MISRFQVRLLKTSSLRGEEPGFISESGMRWKHLPLSFMPWHMVASDFTLSSLRRFLKIMTFDFKSIVLCHATQWGGTSDVDNKLSIYKAAEEAMMYPKRWKFMYCFSFMRVYSRHLKSGLISFVRRN